MRGAAKARRTPEEVLEYQSMDEQIQEMCRAFEDEKNQQKALEGTADEILFHL